jgi:tetratricopeptide (TPR) repeat protein
MAVPLAVAASFLNCLDLPFPLNVAEIAQMYAANMNNTSAPPNWSSKSYLLIDDFSIVHRMLRDMLRKLGAVAIDTVKNGTDAIAMLREKQYDVVLCDYNFAEGPNGQQILEEARHRELIGLTCIWMMVSSEKTIETVMGAAEQAPDGYILKPLTESLLLARLNRAWDRKQAFTAIERAYAERDYQKAAALCDQKLSSAPLHAMDLLRMKASLLLKDGQLQAARMVYEQTLTIREQVWAKAGLARIDSLEGRHTHAKRRLQEIVCEHPSFLDAYDQLAYTLQQLGEMDHALVALQEAAYMSPYSVIRQKNLGDVAQQLGKFDIAEQAYQTSIAVGEYSILKSPDAYLGLAQLYGKTGRTEEAQTLLKTAREYFSDKQVNLLAQAIDNQISGAAYVEKTHPQTQGFLNQTEIAELIPVMNPSPISDYQSSTSSSGASKIAPETLRPTPTAPTVPVPAPASAPVKTHASLAQSVSAPVSPTFQSPDAAASTTAPAVSDNAAPAVPAAAQALYQRAQVLLQYMKTNGYNMVSAEEIRAVLARAEKLLPDHPRTKELLMKLQDLATAGRR